MSSSPRGSSDGGAGDRQHTRQRGSLYRRTLAATYEGDEYMTTLLEALELKRKQLDDQIHKYIAQKEREYKQHEKDIRDQYKKHKQETDESRRKESFNSTGSSNDSTIDTKKLSAADVLLAARSSRGSGSPVAGVEDGDTLTGIKLEHKQVVAGLSGRRESDERESEFVGLFVPPFFPALDHKDDERKPTKVVSAPSPMESSKILGIVPPRPEKAPQRFNADPAVKPETRPSRLKLEQRTSSSGSSADGKSSLVSAMRSPGPGVRAREPMRKRVSLAVGDTIVAPSDNVPDSTKLPNRAPSHSRTRPPAPEHKISPDAELSSSIESDHGVQQDRDLRTDEWHACPLHQSSTECEDECQLAEEARRETCSNSITLPQPEEAPEDRAETLATISPFSADSSEYGVANTATASKGAYEDAESPFDMEEDFIPSDRRTSPNRKDLHGPPSSPSPPLSPTDTSSPREGTSPSRDGGWEHSNRGIAMESPLGIATDQLGGFAPQSLPTSAQQPTSPGFARPSVSTDPMFSKDLLEGLSAQEDHASVYESFGNPSRRSPSMHVGSLGESYMQRHAEEMMRQRVAGGKL